MGRPKKNPKPVVIEPEDESQDIEEQEALEATEPDEEPGGVNKSQAVRAAIDAGKESPDEGVQFVRDRYGIEVSKPYFSAIKSKYRKGAGPAPKATPGRKPRAVENGYLARPPKPAPTGGSELLDAMEAMKPLVASLGKEQVKRIVDLLG